MNVIDKSFCACPQSLNNINAFVANDGLVVIVARIYSDQLDNSIYVIILDTSVSNNNNYKCKLTFI